MEEIDQTQQIKREEPELEEGREHPRKKRRTKWVLLGILMLLFGLGAGGGVGYLRGIDDRMESYQSQVTIQAVNQYQLGLQDMEDGRYEMARTRFEYVIQLDPEFPGVMDKLSEAMLAMATTVEPTPDPTPTVFIEITPTPDLRSQEELFSYAQAGLGNKDWDNVILMLDSLRSVDINYRAVDVDGMYFTALRYRGVDKILVQGNLEGGIYDLTLASQFGPLDVEAQNYRTWARYYLTAQSFWGVDWAQVVYFYSMVYIALPNLRDATNMTATQRYRTALLHYGDQLSNEDRWCEAYEQYQIALSLSPDEMIQPTATYSLEKCEEAEETPPPGD